MPAQIGALRVTLGANTAQYEAGMRRAQVTARTTGASITSSMNRMQATTATSFSKLTRGLGAFGIALGGISLVNYGRQALQFAANLGETAQQIGVTVEQLQILSRIALENGASQETLERSMQKLNRTLGEAKNGNEAAARSFQNLGFTPAQIQGFNQGGDAIREVAQRIMAIPDSARRAAAEVALFGRAGQNLEPTLRAIAVGYDRAAQEALAMGLVTDEQAARADEASDKIDALAYSLRTNLASALADNIGPINDVIQALSSLIRAVGSSLDYLERFRHRLSAFQGAAQEAIGQALSNATGGLLGGDRIRRGRQQQNDARANLNNAGFIGAVGAQFGARSVRRRGSGEGTPGATGGGRGGGGGGGGNAASERNKALREEHDFQSQLSRFRIDELRVAQQRTQDAVIRAGISDQILAAEEAQFIADTNLKVAVDGLSQARARELIAANHSVMEAERTANSAERIRTLSEEEQGLADQRFEIQSAALQAQDGLAQTADERRRAELALLDLTYQHQRAKLDSIIAESEAGSLVQRRAQQERDALDSQDRAARAGVMRNTAGPLEQFLNELPRTAAQANEALQSVAANGLQSLTDGLAEALAGTKSLGSVFKSVANQIVADLLRIAIQRSIIGPLSNVLSGLLGGNALSGIGAGASSTSNLIGGFGFGGARAAGGPVVPGMNYLVGERGPELVRFGARGQVIPNKEIGGKGGDFIFNFAPNFAGNAATKQEMLQLASMVKPMAQEAYRDMARRR